VRFERGAVERLRLIGMDTPETVDPRKPVQCFGQEASTRAKELLDGQTATLELDASQGERDRYGRLLAYLWLPDGRNFAEVMIGEGYAHEYTYQQPYAYQADFKAAAEWAQANGLGLWAPDACAGQPYLSDLADDAPPAEKPE
jgi:micrococcal nuclease